ncbi:MAG: phosphate/phosphite/phosphonate ABC transporter substrate-binding protein [Dehalococcoidia bacterium]
MRVIRRILAVVILGLAALAAACQGGDGEEVTPPRSPAATDNVAKTITLGDVSDEPARKVELFQPVADYLAANLSEFGIEEGRVVIAPNLEAMAELLRTGVVDLYFDSAYPTIVVSDLSGSESILRRWKQGSAEYWSVYFTRKDSGIESRDDLVGKRIAFEEPFSTSGFVLPAGTLLQRGFKLTPYAHPADDVAPGEIGYVFSREDENTLEWVVRGLVSGGATSNLDYDELPEELKSQLVIVGKTIAMPRQIVSVRPGLDPELVDKVKDLLMDLDKSDEGREILRNLKNTRKFDEIPEGTEASLRELKALISQVLLAP